MEWFQGTLFVMRGWEARVKRLGLEKDEVSPELGSLLTGVV
jgi:hypothetical protein